MKRCLLTCFILIISAAAFAQSSNLIFRHLNRSSGLPTDLVTCIARDSMGFIWIGTSEGLYKYDGFSYKQVEGITGEASNILNSHIENLYVDRDGHTWVSIAYGGIVVLKKNGELLAMCNRSNNPSFKTNRSHKIVQDVDGAIWCSTDEGMLQLAIHNNIVIIKQHIDLKKLGHTSNISGDFSFDSKKKIWIGTFTGLAIYDPGSKQLYHSKNNPQQLAILKDSFAARAIYIDEVKGKIWYSNWEPSLKIYDLKTGDIITLYSGKGSLNADYGWMVRYFFKDSHDRLWMTTGRGLFLVNDSLTGLEKQFVHEPGNNTSIAHNSVHDIMQDKEANFWIGTDNGISITSPYDQRFSNYSLNVLKEYPFAGKHVSALIIPDSSTMLVCTHSADGIYETDHELNIKKHYSFHSNDHDWVWEFYEDKKNKQIFISTQKGMLIYNTASHSLKKLISTPFDKFYPVTAFIPGKDGSIWMSRYRNEFINYDPVSGNYTRYSLSEFGIPLQQMKLAQDRDGHLWILGNLSGLYQVDPVTKKVLQSITQQNNNANSLRQVEVIFFKDLGDQIFLGYDQKGFSLFHKQTKTFEHYNRSNGPAGNRVNDALLHKDGNLWIATSNGISSFNLRTREVVSYNYDDGILSNEVFYITALNENTLAACTNKGLVLFDPGKVKARVMIPPPLVTDIMLYGKRFAADSFFNNYNAVKIAYNENYFSLNYICLQYSHQQQVEYAYKLEGFDKDWINAGNRRFTSYANLQGGDYVFKLRARLPGSNWVESETFLNIEVATPFFKRWWFIPLCAMAFALILYALFRYRVRQLIRLEKMRSAISSDLHDEVGATLSSISIFSEMAKQSLPENSKAAPYLQRIGDRSRDSIEKMSDIIWSINPANDSLQEMLIRMKTFVNENVEGKDITVHWEETESIAGLTLGMSQRKNFYLLFKEAIINAVKYADAHHIAVHLSAQNKMVSLKVTDDGKGFNMDTIKLGNGIKNIRNRAMLLNGKAIIDSTPGKGTIVQVNFKN